jgi:hypothetical protein
VGSAVRILMALCVLAVPAAALAAGGSRVYVANCTKAVYKPKRITLACGDGTSSLSALKWTSWTGSQASGRGTENVDTCKPDCVSGKVKHVAATVTLSKPTHCKGLNKHKIFKRLALKFTTGKSQTMTLGCPQRSGGGFY